MIDETDANSRSSTPDTPDASHGTGTSGAGSPDEQVDRSDEALGNNPYANQTVPAAGQQQVGDTGDGPDHPGSEAAGGDHSPGSAGFDPGSLTDGSGDSAPDGEPVDPSGESSDGGESGQDAGLNA